MREVDDAGAQRRLQLVRPAIAVESDDERPVLGVDQVVGAGRSDLAHLGPTDRARERDRLGAAIDLEDHAVLIGEEGAAERGSEELRMAFASSSPSSAAFAPPRPKPPAAFRSSAAAARETKSMVER